MVKLDAIDYRLVQLLQADARSSIKSLAENVFMSPPAVAARLERLEKCGVILGYQPIINEKLFGYHILAFISLQLSPSDKPTFYPFIEKVPNVLECNCVTGDYSMLIKVCFRSTAELDVFIGELQCFGKTYTQIVFSTAIPARGPMLEYAEDANK
ncbi:MAG: Lrp/AsnC family transcriptional regulator [Clostridia bacterium]